MLLMEEKSANTSRHHPGWSTFDMAVSAVTGEGNSDLLAAIENIAQQVQERSAEGYAACRVFTIAGFGT